MIRTKKNVHLNFNDINYKMFKVETFGFGDISLGTVLRTSEKVISVLASETITLENLLEG